MDIIGWVLVAWVIFAMGMGIVSVAMDLYDHLTEHRRSLRPNPRRPFQEDGSNE